MRVIAPPEIPSSFTQLDDTLFTADEFVSVRDQQKLRENHNKLLAERIRLNPAAHHINGSAVSTVTPLSSVTNPPALWYGTALTNPGCHQLQFHFYAKRQFAVPAADPSIGVSLWGIGFSNSRPLDPTNVSTVDVTSTTIGWYSVTMSLPYRRTKGFAQYGYKVPIGYSIFLNSQIDVDSAAVVTGATVVDSTATQTRITTATSIGKSQSAEIVGKNVPPVLLVNPVITKGGDKIFAVDPPWSTIPIAGTDTITIRTVCGVAIEGFSIIESPITDFGDAPGGI